MTTSGRETSEEWGEAIALNESFDYDRDPENMAARVAAAAEQAQRENDLAKNAVALVPVEAEEVDGEVITEEESQQAVDEA